MHHALPSLSLALCSAVVPIAPASGGTDDSDTQPPSVATGPIAEPPARARVHLGAATHDVALGQPRVLDDGQELRVELLPTRAFRVPGSFSFEYPREWTFLAAVGFPSAVDAWWSLNGDGAAIYLRRHTRDAQEIADEYVRNLTATNPSPDRRLDPVPVTGRFGDRDLDGRSCTYDMGPIGPGPTLRWEQQVFGWQEREGVAWLLTIQRTVTPSPAAMTLLEPLELRVIGLQQSTTGAGDLPPSPGGSTHPDVDSFLASFRWE